MAHIRKHKGHKAAYNDVESRIFAKLPRPGVSGVTFQSSYQPDTCHFTHLKIEASN